MDCCTLFVIVILLIKSVTALQVDALFFQLSINNLLSIGRQGISTAKQSQITPRGCHVPFRQSSMIKKLIDHTIQSKSPRVPRLKAVGYGACAEPSDRGKLGPRHPLPQAQTSVTTGRGTVSKAGLGSPKRLNSLVGPV
jgi:hypothetical protein